MELKKKITVGLIVSIIIIFAIFGSAFGAGDLSKRPESNQELTEQQRNHMEKVDEKLNRGWADIKNSFKINDLDQASYFQVDISNLVEFANGEGPIQDKSEIQSILDVINYHWESVPVGTLKPLIIIKNDGSEVLFAYKEVDGINTLNRSFLIEGKWAHDEVKKVKGEAILQIEGDNFVPLNQ